jgi:hypothetical protein
MFRMHTANLMQSLHVDHFFGVFRIRKIYRDLYFVPCIIALALKRTSEMDIKLLHMKPGLSTVGQLINI